MAIKLSIKATDILNRLNAQTKMGDLSKIAKEIKKDHALAMELWQSGKYMARMLASLIMDTKALNTEVVESLYNDMKNHDLPEQEQINDWLMANQLMKHKQTVAMLEAWEQSPSDMQRRSFW